VEVQFSHSFKSEYHRGRFLSNWARKVLGTRGTRRKLSNPMQKGKERVWSEVNDCAKKRGGGREEQKKEGPVGEGRGVLVVTKINGRGGPKRT